MPEANGELAEWWLLPEGCSAGNIEETRHEFLVDELQVKMENHVCDLFEMDPLYLSRVAQSNPDIARILCKDFEHMATYAHCRNVLADQLEKSKAEAMVEPNKDSLEHGRDSRQHRPSVDTSRNKSPEPIAEEERDEEFEAKRTATKQSKFVRNNMGEVFAAKRGSVLRILQAQPVARKSVLEPIVIRDRIRSQTVGPISDPQSGVVGRSSRRIHLDTGARRLAAAGETAVTHGKLIAGATFESCQEVDAGLTRREQNLDGPEMQRRSVGASVRGMPAKSLGCKDGSAAEGKSGRSSLRSSFT